MGFGQHIFLIQSEAQPSNSLVKDWPASLKRYLELLLSKLSGEPIHINNIPVKELDVNSIYTPSTILIPIVTKELLNSVNFKEEIKVFHERSINKGDNNIPWNSRIFKVVQEPQQGHYLLDYLSNSISYDFFHYDSSKDQVVYYDDFTGPDSEKTFWMRLYDLAYDLFKVIDSLKSRESELASIAKSLNPVTVFLAEVGSDIIAQRDALKRELLRSGYKVLPEKSIPRDIESLMKQVKKDLQSSNMAIHLVGSEYGKVDGSNASIADIQNRLASDHFNELEHFDTGTKMNFGRVIWVSPDLGSLSVKQRLFIENLRKDTESMHKSDLLETSIEELKTFVLEKIQKGLAQYERTESKGNKKVVYLIYEPNEAAKCLVIKDFLEKNDFTVIPSDFSGNPDEVRIRHQDNLKRCDATLIYYGKENEGWIKSKQKELIKAVGWGRTKPIATQGIIIQNEYQLSESLQLNEQSIILQNQDKFSPEVMKPFLEKLKA